MTSLVYAVLVCEYTKDLIYKVFDYTTGCEAYSFTTDGYGIFNAGAHKSGCAPYVRRESDINKSAQALTLKDRNTAPHSVPAPFQMKDSSSRLGM